MVQSRGRKGRRAGAIRGGRLAATGAIGYVNLDEAARWFLAAAQQGHPTAAFNIAAFYASGRG